METLKEGSSGNLVLYLQKQLNKINYPVDESGIFDGKTNIAVTTFQTENNLEVDGFVGGQTWLKIYLKTESPRNATSRNERHNNIMKLHPKVRVAVVKVYVQLQSEDIPFKIFEAFRFPERQEELYAQGRTKPGNKVTYARAWSSYHQYGLAVDFVLFINGEWSWDDSKSKIKLWEKMHKFGEEEGLMRLDFETPHLQIKETSSSALKEGKYPKNGDSEWSENLESAILGWKGPIESPPVPVDHSSRPPIN